MICSTVRERSGSIVASVPTTEYVCDTPRWWVRATFEKLPYAMFFRQPVARHADRVQLADGLGDDLVGGDAVGIPPAVHLDADDVFRHEEAPPGVGRRAGAGQGAHALRHHLAHHIVVRLAGGHVNRSV